MDFSLLAYMMIDEHITGKTFNTALQFALLISKITKPKHCPAQMIHQLDHEVSQYTWSSKDIDKYYHADQLSNRNYVWPHLRPPPKSF